MQALRSREISGWVLWSSKPTFTLFQHGHFISILPHSHSWIHNFSRSFTAQGQPHLHGCSPFPAPRSSEGSISLASTSCHAQLPLLTPPTCEARAVSGTALPKAYLPLAELLEADGTDWGGAAAAGRVPARGRPCPGLVAACGQLPDGLQGLLLHRVLHTQTGLEERLSLTLPSRIQNRIIRNLGMILICRGDFLSKLTQPE